ncbi:hypothetical protein HMPREF3149_06065 [Corynebacterium sp. HMSC05E07]|nr:hypothetical protein HMPREF3149_06065 [Corynebacterium sp. HMSC05E07]
MPASLPPVPAVTVPVSAVIALAASIARPRDDMCHPGRNVLVTAWADVELGCGGAADMPHDIGLAMCPAWARDGLRAKEGTAIARQKAWLLADSTIAAWH